MGMTNSAGAIDTSSPATVARSPTSGKANPSEIDGF